MSSLPATEEQEKKIVTPSMILIKAGFTFILIKVTKKIKCLHKNCLKICTA